MQRSCHASSGQLPPERMDLSRVTTLFLGFLGLALSVLGLQKTFLKLIVQLSEHAYWLVLVT